MSRTILQVFEDYQKARILFVQTVADLALRAKNIESLQNAGVMSLLKPLLLDAVPSIQQTAALALGRLAGHSEELAIECVNQDILPQLTQSVAQQNRFYKRSAAFVIRAVSKHSAELAQVVVDSGALEALTSCLEEFDPQVKESAAWAIGYIARHSEVLAQHVVSAGAVRYLAICFQEPEISLKRVSASALCDIAKHSPELAQVVCDSGAIPPLVKQLSHQDSGVKRQVCGCLSKIAAHSVDFAELLVEAEVFPKIFSCLMDTEEIVRRNAATCIREIVRHSHELAKFVVNAGGIAALVDLITETQGATRVPGIMALGYIAAFSETLALAIIVSKGIPPIKQALTTEPEDHIKAAAAWAFGQIGRHTPDHAMAVAEADILRILLALYMSDESSEDLKEKSKRAMKSILQKCSHLAALEPLMKIAPPSILKHVVQQFAKVLPNSVKARRSFVQSGGLEQLLRIRETEAASSFTDVIQEITALFPTDIVNYYSPNYSATLLDKMESTTA